MAVSSTTAPLTSNTERIDYATVLPHATKLLILGAVLLSLFLAALDQTIVATALPAIVRNFNGIDLVSWVSTGYLLASTAMIVLPIYVGYKRRQDLTWSRDWPLLVVGLGGLIFLSIDYTVSYQDALRSVVEHNDRVEADFEARHPEVP